MIFSLYIYINIGWGLECIGAFLTQQGCFCTKMCADRTERWCLHWAVRDRWWHTGTGRWEQWDKLNQLSRWLSWHRGNPSYCLVSIQVLLQKVVMRRDNNLYFTLGWRYSKEILYSLYYLSVLECGDGVNWCSHAFWFWPSSLVQFLEEELNVYVTNQVLGLGAFSFCGHNTHPLICVSIRVSYVALVCCSVF